MEIVSMSANRFEPCAILDARTFVMFCEHETYERRQKQNHDHHDRPWIHACCPSMVHLEVYGTLRELFII